jgi:hypothetical protein
MNKKHRRTEEVEAPSMQEGNGLAIVPVERERQASEAGSEAIPHFLVDNFLGMHISISHPAFGFSKDFSFSVLNGGLSPPPLPSPSLLPFPPPPLLPPPLPSPSISPLFLYQILRLALSPTLHQRTPPPGFGKFPQKTRTKKVGPDKPTKLHLPTRNSLRRRSRDKNAHHPAPRLGLLGSESQRQIRGPNSRMVNSKNKTPKFLGNGLCFRRRLPYGRF